MFIIVMGVSGCGKSVVGSRLAERLGAHYAEGDEFHSKANIEKMRSGIPLDDDDRWPWLNAIAEAIDDWRTHDRDAMIACSALKKAYRDILGGGRDDVVFVHLEGSMDLIASRMAKRQHEYMPATLLQSQFDTLEPPDEKAENVITVDIAPEPETIVEIVLDRLRKRGMIA
ncbi:MAG: gluconokinase [Rhodospirillales bacterium]|jgi:gluconokinase|nr:gluconokinase [Rhodospirillales bacterium]